jgi:hypothetical protein
MRLTFHIKIKGLEFGQIGKDDNESLSPKEAQERFSGAVEASGCLAQVAARTSSRPFSA